MDARSRSFLMRRFLRNAPLSDIAGAPQSQPDNTPLTAPGRHLATLMATLIALAPAAVFAGDREQAARMHSRLTGVPPSETVLTQMETEIGNGNAVAAAYIAMEDPAFYNVTVKNLAAPWTNEAMTPFVPLNDYTATVIGLVRDEADFRTVLYDDVVYVGSVGGVPAYSTGDNRHYEELEASGDSLGDVLQRRTQSSLTGVPPQATAGVMTTRAAARAFFIDGTNRAMFRFTLMNHLCNDLEQVADVTLPADRIRQDVSRSPGGDSRVFLNNCAGCHTGMDPLAQAFAYYDYEYSGDAELG